MTPLGDDALGEIWSHHNNDIAKAREAGMGARPFNQAQIDRRVLLVEIQRLRELVARLDLDLIDAQGRLQDAEL